jgi:hypothetical protein
MVAMAEVKAFHPAAHAHGHGDGAHGEKPVAV